MQTNDQKISVAKKENLNDIVELNKQLHLDIESFKWDQPEYIKEEIRKGNYYVAKEGSQVVGAIDIQRPGVDELYIEVLVVDPKKHGFGIGKKLIAFAKNVARRWKCKKLTVESFQSYNVQGFYKKVGFRLDTPPVGYCEGLPFHRFVMDL